MAIFASQLGRATLALMGFALLIGSCRPLMGGSGLLSLDNQTPALPENLEDTFWALALEDGGSCLYLMHFADKTQTDVVSCPGHVGVSKYRVSTHNAETATVSAKDQTGKVRTFEFPSPKLLTPTSKADSCTDTPDPSAVLPANYFSSPEGQESVLYTWSRKTDKALTYRKIAKAEFNKVLEQAECTL